jgi:hypothetical protein
MPVKRKKRETNWKKKCNKSFVFKRSPPRIKKPLK